MQGSLLKKVLIIIPALFIPLIYSKSTVDPVLLPKFLAFSIYILFFLIVLSYSFFTKKENQISILNNYLFKFFTAFIIISGLSLITSINLPDAIFEWTKIVLSFSFLIIAALYFKDDDNFIENLCKAIGLLSVIVNVIGYYQFYWLAKKQGITHNSTYLVDGTFANRNLFAEVLLLTLPFGIYGALKFQTVWKIICSLATFSSLFLITATLTRAVWLGLIISGACTIILFFLFKLKKREQQSDNFDLRKFGIPAILVLLTISAAVFVYSRQDTEETFQKQIIAITNVNYGGGNERIELWKKSFDIFKEHPLKGVGLASWKIEILKYSVVGSKSEDATTFYQEPHNDFIMIAAESGVFGVIFYLLLFTTVIYYIIVILKNTEGSKHLFYYLMFFGIISYCIISFFSFPKERIEQNILLMFMFIGVIIQYQKVKHTIAQKEIQSNFLRYFSILLFIPVLFSMFIGIKRIQSDVHTLKALNAKSKGKWQEVILQIDKAISPYYVMDPMSTPLAWYSGSAHFNLGHQSEALRDFEIAYSINPYHVHILNNLGTCYEIKKDHQKAIEYFNKALAINPFLEDAILNLSASYFNSGMIDSAYASVRKCDLKSENPRYKSSLPVIVTAKFKSIKNSLNDFQVVYAVLIQKDWPSRKTKFSKLSPEEFAQLYKSCLSTYISPFSNNNEWMLKIHEKSVRNKISLEEQAFIDAHFLLKK